MRRPAGRYLATLAACAILASSASAQTIDAAREVKAQSVSRLFLPAFDAASATDDTVVGRPSFTFAISDANKTARANIGVLVAGETLLEARFEAPISGDSTTIASTTGLPAKAKAEGRAQFLVWSRYLDANGARVTLSQAASQLNSQERSRKDLTRHAIAERLAVGDIRPTDALFVSGSLGYSQLSSQYVTKENLTPQPGRLDGTSWSGGLTWVRTKVECLQNPDGTCATDDQGNIKKVARPGYLFSVAHRRDEVLKEGTATEICQAFTVDALRCDQRIVDAPTLAAKEQTSLQFHYWASSRYALGARYLSIAGSPEWTFEFPLTILILVDDAHADKPNPKPGPSGLPQLSGAVTAGWVRDAKQRQFVVTVTLGTTFEIPRLMR